MRWIWREYWSNTSLSWFTHSLLQSVYPETDWKPWKFKNLNSIGNNEAVFADRNLHKIYFDYLTNLFQLSPPTHFNDSSSSPSPSVNSWYSMRLSRVKGLDFYGNYILSHYYQNSLYQALKTLYPEADWRPWRFVHQFQTRSSPSTNDINNTNNNNNQSTSKQWIFSWDQREHQKIYMEWLANELNLQELDDWYRVTIEDVSTRDGIPLLKLYQGSLSKALETIYPDHHWQSWKFYGMDSNRAINHKKFFDG